MDRYGRSKLKQEDKKGKVKGDRCLTDSVGNKLTACLCCLFQISLANLGVCLLFNTVSTFRHHSSEYNVVINVSNDSFLTKTEVA